MFFFHQIEIAFIDISSLQIHKKMSKRNISAEKRVLYGKLGQYQKIHEITAGHLSFGLGQSPQSFIILAPSNFVEYNRIILVSDISSSRSSS